MSKTLKFPDYCVGRLYTEDDQIGMRFVSEARGHVTIASDRPITLRLNTDVYDLSWILLLQPDSLSSLNCHAGNFEGGQLTHVRHLSTLSSLQLSYCRVDDRHVESLSQLESLHTLRLDWTNVGDEGLKRLTSLTSLNTLDLSRTRISDAALSSITTLQNLSHLALWDCKLRGSNLSALKVLPNLSHLWLSRTRLDDTTGTQFKELKHVRALAVAESAIGDDTVKSLSPLPIESLDISHTRVTDKSIETLCDLQYLNDLIATDTLLSPDGAAEVRRRRPSLRFSHSQKSQKTKIASFHKTAPTPH